MTLTIKNKYRIALLSVALSAQAATATTVYLLDFNDAADAGGYPSPNWNSFDTSASINTTLQDSDGITTAGITSSLIAGSLTDLSGITTNTSPSGPSWVGSSTQTAAAGDHFYTNLNTGAGEEESYTIGFAGLSAGSEVSLDLWVSRIGGSYTTKGFYDYSLDGGSTWIGFSVLKSNGDAETASGWDTKTTALSGGQSYDAQTDGGAAGRYMSTQTITLTSTTLQFRGWDAPGAYASIGAARLTIVPETETYALLAGVCGLTFVILRRRR